MSTVLETPRPLARSVPPTFRGPSEPATGLKLETLVDQYLAEQRELRPVERFARLHETDGVPLLEGHYRDLIPLTVPKPGQQYAFEVDIDRCSGCKACVSACHSLNGLDEGEAWREVGILSPPPKPVGRRGNIIPLTPVGAPKREEPAVSQFITTACHHCVEPSCLLGCPVLAYEKDPITGIVHHLDDQCIGCSYCVMKCPYEVPKYSVARGIVRKCDLCRGRLESDEAPACVQACPSKAIRVTLVEQVDVRKRWESDVVSENAVVSPRWLPDAPDPAITLPTTRYLSTRNQSDLVAVDHSRRPLQPAHWPLIGMLVLTQAGIGGFASELILELSGKGQSLPAVALSFALLAAGLVASVFHLGQPLKAWRVWLGWKTSWLSREAIALNLFAGVATTILVGRIASVLPIGQSLPERLQWVMNVICGVPALGFAVVTGLVAVGAQMMVYVDTRRRFWRLAETGPRFYLTTILLGSATTSLWVASPLQAGLILGASLLLGMSETRLWVGSKPGEGMELKRTRDLLQGPLRGEFKLRIILGVLGGILLPVWMLVRGGSDVAAALAAVAFATAIIERHLFFTAVSPNRMPGGL